MICYNHLNKENISLGFCPKINPSVLLSENSISWLYRHTFKTLHTSSHEMNAFFSIDTTLLKNYSDLHFVCSSRKHCIVYSIHLSGPTTFFFQHFPHCACVLACHVFKST